MSSLLFFKHQHLIDRSEILPKHAHDHKLIALKNTAFEPKKWVKYWRRSTNIRIANEN
jgi:hypothetical protein